MAKQISLEEFLEQQEQVNERFVVDSDEKANWVLRKLKHLQKKKQENIALAEAEIAKINAWLEHVNGDLDSQIQFFEDHLAEYAERLRQKDSKFKSMKLPNGRFGFRKQPAKWHYDEKVLLNQLKENGRNDLIRIKEEIDKQAIKKQFKVIDGRVIDPETGEVINGVTVEEQGEKLKIEVSE
ncbi:host-nuclease inhibitor Gam family protein [Thermoflavimicrobium dichotomicum]|uniref:Bacteriophage Mu Gam like protein n=1 Tax=Thermoflavimicrobium dichotomicum TaxID=46223 RepID=A0A1I3ULD1_9BACL|nr:host-nuclease inhibitor Gam family protein [Thermoflavimicrobium dichotomicum]SFJ82666.1 Bacteriophage Mu Gam like protein [Thermoflavimicrobium dichotomicum]